MQKCKRRFQIWLFRRLTRCLKRLIFGKPRKRNIQGYQLGGDKKSSVITLYRNKRKSTKSIGIGKAITNELDAYSVSKSLGKRVKSYVDDLKENNIYLDLDKTTALNLNSEEKQRFKKLADKVEKENELKELERLKDIVMLQRKFSITPSKRAVLNSLVEDYKIGKFSFSNFPFKSKLNINTIDKNDLNKIIAHYESEKKKKHNDFKKQSKFKQLRSDFREKLKL